MTGRGRIGFIETNMKPTAYYAHPIALYRSDIENRDLKTLRALGFKVINPALKKYSTLQMADFVNLAVSCDLIAFRSFEDGKIGSGMWLEIKAAREAGKPVIELDSVLSLSGRVLTRNETRERMCLPPLRHPNTAPIRTVIEDTDEDDKLTYEDAWINGPTTPYKPHAPGEGGFVGTGYDNRGDGDLPPGVM